MRGGDPRPPHLDVRRGGPPLRAASRRRPGPGTVTPYEVRLDGDPVWPPADDRPPPVVHTRDERAAVAHRLRVVPPGRPRAHGSRGRLARGGARNRDRCAVDVLEAAAARARWSGPTWFSSSATRCTPTRCRPRRSRSSRRAAARDEPPGEQIADFEEYTRLYRESWSEPDIRWLLSTVPTAMIFDDHDVHDDWNISWRWIDEMRRTRGGRRGSPAPSWRTGCTSTSAISRRPSWTPRRRCRASRRRMTRARCCASSRTRGIASRRRAAGPSTATSATRACSCSTRARPASSRTGGARWSTTRSGTGSSSTRAAPSTILIVASTLPVFLAIGIHHLQAWNEALCAGRWGRLAANLSERLRRAVDLEHWAAFNRSFEQVCDWLRSSPRSRRIRSTVLRALLGGDVHYSSISEVDLRCGQGSRVHQLVCSPFRNPSRREGAAGRAGDRVPRRCTGLREARRVGGGRSSERDLGAAAATDLRECDLGAHARPGRTRVSSSAAARAKARIRSVSSPRPPCRSRATHRPERARGQPASSRTTIRLPSMRTTASQGITSCAARGRGRRDARASARRPTQRPVTRSLRRGQLAAQVVAAAERAARLGHDLAALERRERPHLSAPGIFSR